MTAGMVRRMGATLAALFCLGLSAIAVAQGTVVPPNGTLSADVVDLSVQTSAGPVEWKRTFNGTGWRFNRHWDGISASFKPVMTQNTGGGAPDMSYGSQGGAPATCWIWVDEDWQPGDGVTVPIGGGSGGSTPAPAVPPETYLPANRSYNQTASPLDTVITTGFASGCASIGGNLVGNSSEVLEGYRRQSTLYVGAGGTYIFKNRFTLQKQPIQKLAPITLPIGGSVSFVGLTSVASGWRWSDRAGDWAEYDDDGRISRYGDKNNNTVWLQRNAAGQIVRIIDGGTAAVSGNVIITLHYDAKGYLTQAKDWPQAGNSLDLAQRTVTYTYDTQGRMTGVTDVRGNTTAYEYDSKQRLTKTTDPRGGETKLTYDAEGTSVKTMTAADGGVTEYGSSWDSTKKLFYSKVTGPATAAGRRVDDYSHDRAGDLVKYEINGRMETEIKRDPSTRTETRTNARGFATTYTRDEYEQVIQAQFPDGTKTSTVYDPRLLNPIEDTDQLGVKTRYEYDAKGNLIRKIEAQGLPEQRITEYQLDNAGRPIRIIRKGRLESSGEATPDSIWQIAYDSAGLLSSTVDPEGNSRSFIYNRVGQLVKYTDPKSNSITYETDARGKLIKATNALNHVRSFSYDKNGNLIGRTDARGKTVQLAYDSMNRMAQTTNEVGGVVKIEFDVRGMPTKRTDEDGRSIKFGVDNFLRLIEQSDALSNSIVYGYDLVDGSSAGALGSLSRPTEIKYPTYSRQVKFDARERPTSQKILNQGASKLQSLISSKTYDGRGALKTETDANGKSRSFVYSPLGQLVEITNRLGAKIKAIYDARGNLVRVIDPNGNSTSYKYDRNNRLVQEILPLGQVTSYEYDASSNLVAKTDALGIKQQFLYDEANRLVEIRHLKEGSQIRGANLSWDLEGNLTGWSDTDLTRPISQQTTNGVLTYDDAGRKTSVTFNYPNPAGGTYPLKYEYRYSLGGDKTALIWADGTSIGYGYSQHGELESISIEGEGSIAVSQFKWVAPAKTTLPGGGIQERTWDGLLNLEGMKVRTPGQQVSMNLVNTYGQVQEIKAADRTDTVGGISRGVRQDYSYDDEVRLTQVKKNTGGLGEDTEIFTLDDTANRTSHNKVGSGPWIYDANNRLTQRPAIAGNVVYEFDLNGNQITKTENGSITKYSYDSSNRLIGISDGSGRSIAAYGYDLFNRRTWKEQYRDKQGVALVQAKRTYYLYSDEGLIAEATQAIGLNPDGSSHAEQLPAISAQYGLKPDAKFSTGAVFVKRKNSNDQEIFSYYHSNHLDAPIQATDKDGRVVWAANYDAFGQASIITPEATADRPTIVSNLRLPGQYEDEETGLHYNWNRFYDPQIGRYISSDPAGLRGGVNRFLYASARPTVNVDPSGLWSSKGIDATKVHQEAGERVYGRELSRREINAINSGHEWADGPENQKQKHDYMHAMRQPGQSPQEACEQANSYLSDLADQMFFEKEIAGPKFILNKISNPFSDFIDGHFPGPMQGEERALETFGRALHVMQDNTSPAHGGFQEWQDKEPPMDIAEHVMQELFYPGRGSELDLVTKKAWDAYKSGDKSAFRLKCPCDD